MASSRITSKWFRFYVGFLRPHFIPFRYGKHHSASPATYFIGRFPRSPAFLFKISANEIFLFDEVSGLCNSLNTLLVVLQDNIFLNWTSSRTNAAPFSTRLSWIRLRTEQDLNLTLLAIIICLFGTLFVSLESVCQGNLRVKSWL